MRRFAVQTTAALCALALAQTGEAGAQGFGVYEHDACTMARAGTGVAAPCPGGSAVYFNPAGIVGSGNRWNVTVGNTLITLDFNYRDSVFNSSTDAVKNNIPIPAAYITGQLGPRLAVGFGVFAPYGLKVEWPTTFEGRFLAYSSDLASIYFQPTVAFRATPWLRFGAGVNYIHSTVELKQRADLSPQTAAAGITFQMLGVPVGTDFADATLTGSANSWGGHFGVIIEPHPRVSIGARYMMRSEANIDADATFEQINTGIVLPAGNPLSLPAGTSLDALVAPQFQTGGLLVPQSASTTIPLPAQLVVGVAVKATPRLTLLFDWQRVQWSTFEALPLNFELLPDDSLYEDYEDTDGYRFGADFQMSPRLNLRAGYLYHTAAAPPQTVTPLLPEGERTEFTAGLGITLGPRVRLDVAYQRITQQDRRGRIMDTPRYSTANNTGIYTGGANLFGASFALGF